MTQNQLTASRAGEMKELLHSQFPVSTKLQDQIVLIYFVFCLQGEEVLTSNAQQAPLVKQTSQNIDLQCETNSG